MTEDLHSYIEFNEHYMQIFTEELPASLYALADDPSPRNQVRASVTYNHIVEGTLALTGYFTWAKICTSRGILPGMQQVIKHIGDDERRHMAWGTFTCRRHVAADDAMYDVVDERMQELIVPSMGVVTGGTFDKVEADGGTVPFDVDMNELAEYAMDKLVAGSGGRSSRARGGGPRGDRRRRFTRGTGGAVPCGGHP